MEYNYPKKSILKWIVLYVIIAALAYGAIYYFWFYEKSGLDIGGLEQDGAPKIQNINPGSGPKGTIVEIKGTGLAGFEGDLNVYFERKDGKRTMLTDHDEDYVKTGDTFMKVKLIEPCQKGEKITGEYSGIESECDYVELVPGIYKVYVEPWGKRSNVVNFKIIK